MALFALVLGGAVSAVLLVAVNPDAGTARVLVAQRDLPAGALLTADAVEGASVRLGPSLALAFRESDAGRVAGLHTSHQLLAGQILQRSDLTSALATSPLRAVLVAVRSAPPLAAGDHVDLLVLSGAGDTTAVVPFASGLLVRAQVSGGLVLAVDPVQAGALAYAGATTPLVAVASSGDGGGEEPVSTLQQAQDLARR